MSKEDKKPKKEEPKNNDSSKQKKSTNDAPQKKKYNTKAQYEAAIDRVQTTIGNKLELEKTLQQELAEIIRQERDQLRYVVGGIILTHLEELQATYPKLLEAIYDKANKRDRIKFVKAGLIEGDEKKLKEENKEECKASLKEIETGNELSGEDKKNLNTILESFNKPDCTRERKVYGRKAQALVYVGQNTELRISDELAEHLLKNCGFVE